MREIDMCAGSDFECDCDCPCSKNLGLQDCEWPECGKQGLCHCGDACVGCAKLQEAVSAV